MKASEFFTQEWGTGLIKATLSEKKGLLEMSMEDIYSTMEKYAELRLSNVVVQSEQLSKRPNTSSTWDRFTKSEKQQKGNV